MHPDFTCYTSLVEGQQSRPSIPAKPSTVTRFLKGYLAAVEKAEIAIARSPTTIRTTQALNGRRSSEGRIRSLEGLPC